MASYGAYAACTWLRYGRVNPPHADEEDALLDRFMPVYEVAERHHVRVHAPCDVTMAAASEMDLQQSWIVRSIFKGREWIMRSESASEPQTRSFLEQVRALGWGKLAEVAGREIVMGAVTQPWLPNVVFRSMPPEQFASFNDPDYVKIAWTLRVDPINPIESAFRTETRVQCTDATARAKFRRYWSFASPGIILIRWISLSLVKHEAERRVRKIRHTVLSSTANIPLN
jgi:hypothetical protein